MIMTNVRWKFSLMMALNKKIVPVKGEKCLIEFLVLYLLVPMCSMMNDLKISKKKHNENNVYLGNEDNSQNS